MLQTAGAMQTKPLRKPDIIRASRVAANGACERLWDYPKFVEVTALRDEEWRIACQLTRDPKALVGGGHEV